MKVEHCELPDGYYVIGPGRLANAVTWLEMRHPPSEPVAEPLRLAPVEEADRDRCGDLYRTIGTPWLWSRAAAPALPRNRSIENYLAHDDAGGEIGIVELTREALEVEISYFGLVPGATGRGLGKRLMAAALDLAWPDATRVWLHTCHFDHPAALRFYQACGFVPYAVGFEIMADPRLSGALPPTAAPHVPFLPTS